MFLGLTVLAENINRMRYMSHFRSVHRGAFFQEMRTSEPRQLLPEAWGEGYDYLIYFNFFFIIPCPLVQFMMDKQESTFIILIIYIYILFTKICDDPLLESSLFKKIFIPNMSNSVHDYVASPHF
jgi:hypothetical protein